MRPSVQSINRHIPCTLSATVTRRDASLLLVNFDLAIPALGFVVNTKCVIDAATLYGNPAPEEALFLVGKQGLAQALKILRSGSVTADDRAFPEPDSAPEQPEVLPSFSQSDREAFRALGIQV